MELSQKYNFLQWVGVGVLLGIGFVFPVVWLLGIVGISYVVYLAIHTQSKTALIIGALTAWTTKSAFALTWFWSVYPIEWLAFDLGKIQLIIIFCYWFTASLWLGVGGVVFAGVTHYLYQVFSSRYIYLVLPFVWVLSEIIAATIFSAITFGEGSYITSAFSFGYMGYLLAQHSVLIELAAVYGVYALSFCMVVLAVAVFLLPQITVKKQVYIYTSFILFLGFSGHIPIATAPQEITEGYSVVVIDTQFPPNQIRTEAGAVAIRAELEKAVAVALELEPDYILLPEDGRFFNQSMSPQQAKTLFRFQYGNPKAIIVDSSRAQVAGQTVLQSYIYNGQENVVDQSQKRYLVPQGEFMPTLYVNTLKLFGYGSLVETIGKDISYEVGTKTSQADFAQSTPGVLFCFESVSPWGVRSVLAERGTVPFIAHPISHSWFHESTILWQNLDSMLRVQAIWNRQYIVSAGSHVPGQVITPAGIIISPETVASGEQWQVRQTVIPY